MPVKKTNHIHKLIRHRYKTGVEVYFCVNDCNFRMSPELCLGKIVECWRCHKPFQMNKYATELKKPHCEDCHSYKSDKKNPKRRKEDLANLSNAETNNPQPLAAISDMAGDNLIDTLRGQLDKLTSESVVSSPIQQSTTIIREFKLEDEEDLL